ncbi:protein PHOTOPERIOD-INDEPENDENT EARLY FLOWERING 1-like isoform X2 [Pyrus x bretschneideri]|uniref:protein PHOTOPERIOD-INDEPENDENT EARLY FLOWERING 1-like isoform X2 n=2 Tax=Pyrus x bretschneideri TaxID=225117 RepID=UPI00202E7BBB|nr:protein PHOTOPERIOD-INDEPENDENT EARLY FLOWERING 1-like isoform X2 [Pyrus x bretschneideri]
MLDQATRGEKKLREEEQRIKKVALNISKDVKKFWLKIEKLVFYKHQMELDKKKRKALDKLKFLLGQTERYSTMLAENLGDSYKPVQQYPTQDQPSIQCKEMDKNDTNKSTELNARERANIDAAADDDYDVQSDDITLQKAISLYPIRLRKASQTLSVVVVVWEVMAICPFQKAIYQRLR